MPLLRVSVKAAPFLLFFCFRRPPGPQKVALGTSCCVLKGPKASQEAFDRWLAAQPHAVKIVVRGNHDDHNAKFGRSGARFVARRPALLRVCGLRVLVMPFSRRRGAHTRAGGGGEAVGRVGRLLVLRHGRRGSRSLGGGGAGAAA